LLLIDNAGGHNCSLFEFLDSLTNVNVHFCTWLDFYHMLNYGYTVEPTYFKWRFTNWTELQIGLKESNNNKSKSI